MRGPPGVGKSHLLCGLGIWSIQLGFSTRYFRFDELLLALRADCDEQIPAAAFIGHLQQVLHIDRQIARLIGLEDPVRMPSSLPACEERSASSPPVPKLAQDRFCHEKRGPARVYVIIRDGALACKTGCRLTAAKELAPNLDTKHLQEAQRKAITQEEQERL
jgi:hypothetical protein